MMDINFSERVICAYRFAEDKHSGQRRKAGQPYITHPLAVAEYLKEKGYDEDYQIAGLFHDLLEDTSARPEEILELSSAQVLDAVRLLTKEKGYDPREYIERIKNNPIAFAVKTADRIHNLSCAHEADEGFRKRYIKDTLDWYMDFSPEIYILVKKLNETLSSPFEDI